MATYYGRFEDKSGNIYYSECQAADVKMTDGSTAQQKITSIDTKYTNLQTRVNALDTQFQAILDAN